MIGVGVSFPSGRFHATPWGRHVNEGVPEWPPSPWRFLRALIATWRGKLDEQIERPDVEILLRSLMAPPQFVLPPASPGHTRHYMPWFKKGPDDKTLVFDAFVCVPRQARVILLWPDTTIGDCQRDRLGLLLRHLNFFGRAEAWCSAGLLDDAEADKALANVNCSPIYGAAAPSDHEIVRVLCGDPDTAFDKYTPKHEHTSGIRGSRKTVRVPVYDSNWHLCMDTLELHAKKWSDPPGSRWVAYIRRRDCFRVEPVLRRSRSASRCKMQVARYVFDSTVLPLVTETLPVAESVRRALMGIYGRRFPATDGTRGRSAILAGKGEDSQPLHGHGHAYYLPTDEDGDGRLDHLTIVAADGFGDNELRALDELRELKSRDRDESGHPLLALLLGLGRLEDYRAGPLCLSQVWESATPFLAPRHLKKRGTKRDPVQVWHSNQLFLDFVLREELARLITRRPDLNDLTLDAVSIEALVDQNAVFRTGSRNLRPIQFKRFRQKRGDDGGIRPAGFFRLDFGGQVQGPIALGHSCHFGLGLFVPVP